jgi:Zn-finger nucleic acid-binding protein
MTEAATLRCPSCGASVRPEAVVCSHCAVSLHPVRCPWCFDWTFAEARDCARCGSLPEPAAVKSTCPSCREPLSARKRGSATLAGCAGCGGVWADPVSFKEICAERETEAAYLGEGSLLPPPKTEDPQSSPIVYRPCAVCAELMNRFNFADCSGVILDVCKPHGVWFDPDELRRIVAFIHGGGMDVARARERQKLEAERQRRELGESAPFGPEGHRPPALVSIASSRYLLKFLLDKG